MKYNSESLDTVRIDAKSITFITFALYKKLHKVNQKNVQKLYFSIYILYNILIYIYLREYKTITFNITLL